MTTTRLGLTRDTLDPERWQRLKAILASALEESSASARAAAIERACADDTQLLREAESLLHEAEELLDSPTDDLEDCADHATTLLRQDELSLIGKRIGAYVIVRELGRGGMGAVYLGARADGEFEKEVAIKLLKRGTDTDEILRRFRTERQILARLEHPNIARLIDAGTTDDGLPYFVMEYVVGAPITWFVREHALSLDERLELFLKVCAAVEVAHSQMVVHRDLKPSNILVDSHREPKLLDFGIAKLLAPGKDELERTSAGHERLTPVCASPEQVRGKPVTVATDIYALGALLYEILTGKRPHRFTSSRPSSDEIARTISEQEPIAPSLAAAGSEVQRQLHGNLDHIVLIALQKEPERRYASVAELAGDVRLHRQGVRLHGRPRRYQPKQFVRLYRRPALLTTGLVVIGLLLSLWFLAARRAGEPAKSAHSALPNVLSSIPEKSIAVLPFQNLSTAEENAFFADGVQDAILTDLAKVADLKVISRSSVANWVSGAPRNLTQIGTQLNVAHLLQGSVQRFGNRVRVSAQLVDARTGAQLWAESYDRDLADVFAIQSEISKAIVGQLRARLLPSEKTEIEAPPTRDLAAYGLYLQAKEIVNGYLDAAEPGISLRQAIRLLDEAVTRDPGFIVAYCYAARAHSLLFALGLDMSEARVREARKALDAALRLQPDSAEAHLAVAEWHYRCFLAFDAAQKELAIARPGLPNSTPFYVLAGNVYRRQGRWQEAQLSFQKAIELDPRNPNAVNFLADTQILMRNFPEAIETYQRARRAGLDTPILAVRMAIAGFAATGRTDQLRAALAAAPPGLDVGGGETPLRILLALADRDYDGARRILAASPRSSFQDVDFSFYYPRAWYEGMIARSAGDNNAARLAFEAALVRLEPIGGVGGPRSRGVVAQAYAALGMKQKAIDEGVTAVKGMSMSDDAYLGPLILQSLAEVYAWSDEKDKAFATLEQLLQEPGYVSYGYLLVDPWWDPLRGDPRFQRILASLAPRE